MHATSAEAGATRVAFMVVAVSILGISPRTCLETAATGLTLRDLC
jgi:hypothetical protein